MGIFYVEARKVLPYSKRITRHKRTNTLEKIHTMGSLFSLVIRSLGAKLQLMTSTMLKERFPWLNTDGIAIGCFGTRLVPNVFVIIFDLFTFDRRTKRRLVRSMDTVECIPTEGFVAWRCLSQWFVLTHRRNISFVHIHLFVAELVGFDKAQRVWADGTIENQLDKALVSQMHENAPLCCSSNIDMYLAAVCRVRLRCFYASSIKQRSLSMTHRHTHIDLNWNASNSTIVVRYLVFDCCLQILSADDNQIYPIDASMFINAAGPWANDVAKMAGIGVTSQCPVALPVEPRYCSSHM
jgi:hypothetical protein